MIAPGPRGQWLIGSLAAAQRDPLRMINEAVRDHGDLVRLTFGPMVAHLIRHPDLIKHVLQDASPRYGRKTRAFSNMRLVIGNGLLTSEGDFWLRQRRIAQPAFHKQRLGAFALSMTRAAEEMVAQWKGDLDVAEEMMRVTLRIVGETLLGQDPSAEASEVAGAMMEVLRFVKARSTQLLPLPPGWPTPMHLRFRRAKATLDRVLYGLIAARQKDGADRGDLLSLLLHARDEETGQGMTPEQLRDEVMTMFLAGHETTANVLSWSFALLGESPSVLRALEEEVRGALQGRSPTLEDLPKLGLTRRVIEETMRLYPPVWMIPRSVEQDDELGGYEIKAKSLMLISVYLTHRHPDFWERPLEFDPSRFAPEVTRPRFAYVPFGGGPHLCIGNAYAMLEARLVLATVVQRMHFELVPAQKLEPEPMITLRPRYGVRLRVRPH